MNPQFVLNVKVLIGINHDRIKRNKMVDMKQFENKIILGDCIENLKKIPDNSIDLIITSPPYEDVAGAGYGAKTKDILFLKTLF